MPSKMGTGWATDWYPWATASFKRHRNNYGGLEFHPLDRVRGVALSIAEYFHDDIAFAEVSYFVDVFFRCFGTR